MQFSGTQNVIHSIRFSACPTNVFKVNIYLRHKTIQTNITSGFNTFWLRFTRNHYPNQWFSTFCSDGTLYKALIGSQNPALCWNNIYILKFWTLSISYLPFWCRLYDITSRAYILQHSSVVHKHYEQHFYCIFPATLWIEYILEQHK